MPIVNRSIQCLYNLPSNLDQSQKELLVNIDLIKQSALVQATGYLSGKEGLHNELKTAEQFAERGYFVLLNDLTHCLKAGDLTLYRNQMIEQGVDVTWKGNQTDYRLASSRRYVECCRTSTTLP
jgi:hypothetical protein